MAKVFLVYKTDNLHSYNSRDIIGVATREAKAIVICKLQARKEGWKLTEDQLFNLNNSKQTQGYSGEGEFQIEQVEKNVLL